MCARNHVCARAHIHGQAYMLTTHKHLRTAYMLTTNMPPCARAHTHTCLLISLQEDVAAGRISNAQLESVLYACMRFNLKLPDGAYCIIVDCATTVLQFVLYAVQFGTCTAKMADPCPA